jgi:adenosylcobyric acid synthase
VGNFSAGEYFARKKELIPDILRAFRRLEEQADIIVIEGAGSPAEINLKENDIVNMGMAKLVDAPVLLVGDIDRGGVFAQLLGTLMLLDEEERARVKGLVINKFRGDKSILDPGVRMLEERGGIPVTGVIPYMELSLEDEDSLTERFQRREAGMIDLAVIRYPRISNFTDFDVFEQAEGVSLRYVRSVAELGNPDMIFLPGSKNTMEDLRWMRECGLEAAVKKRAGRTVIFGICGGYQMLGKRISDPYEVEQGGSMRGMELLAVETVLERQKIRRTVRGNIGQMEGILANLSGQEVEGYELHMGCTRHPDGGECPMVVCQEEVYGSYVHGIFDKNDMAARLLRALAERKGTLLDTGGMMDYRVYKETQYDKLADGLRAHLELDEVYGMLREAKI